MYNPFDAEQRSQRFMLRIGAAVALLFCVSLFKSCREIEYSVFGNEATATVMRVKDIPPAGRRRGEPQVSVEYEFPDADGVKHQSFVHVDAATWRASPVTEFAVVYLSYAPDVSVPTAMRAVWPLVTLGVMTAAGIGWLVLIVKRANDGRL